MKKLGGLILAEINMMWKDYKPIVMSEGLLSALPSSAHSSNIKLDLGDPFFIEEPK